MASSCWSRSHRRRPTRPTWVSCCTSTRIECDRAALARLAESGEDTDNLDEQSDEVEQAAERRISLGEQRHESVLEAVRALGGGKVADLGCGEGRLLQRLVSEPSVTDVLGVDVSVGALEQAQRRKERFARVYTLGSVTELDTVEVVRTRLWNDRRDDAGPFDIIGDVHGCHTELMGLLDRLGYDTSADPIVHPDGRRAVFLGDLVDRGPGVAEVLDVAMSMVSVGS